MADEFEGVALSELPEALEVTDDDLFLLEQAAAAKKLTGKTLVAFLLKLLKGHGGITSIKKTGTDGLVDTYTITFVDGNTETFTITNGEQGAKGEQGAQGDPGDRGKAIFYSHSETQVTEDTSFNPAMIETNGETLRVGDMILVPAGNLFQITKLPTDTEYIIYARYLTSLMGPEGPSRDYGIAFYQTTKEPPEELRNSVYVFNLDTVLTQGNELRSGDFIFDANYNLFRVEAVGATDLRASWVTTWSQNTGSVELPESFNYVILKSSTQNSFKQFKVSVDDSGTLTATEIINLGTVTISDPVYWGAFEGELSFAIGMTWADFCNSEYNTQNFYVDGSYIKEQSGCYLLYKPTSNAYMPIAPSNKIVDGRVYEWDMQ